jgi:hypothetical protein
VPNVVEGMIGKNYEAQSKLIRSRTASHTPSFLGHRALDCIPGGSFGGEGERRTNHRWLHAGICAWTDTETLQPADLVKEMADGKSVNRPVVICTGFRTLFKGAHDEDSIEGALFRPLRDSAIAGGRKADAVATA